MGLSAGTKLGPYEVVASLGAGGMGEVYRAKDTRLGREVAVKVPPEDFFEDRERRDRFEREAKLLAALNHPGIAAIYAFEENPGSPGFPGRHLLVMELVEGDDLAQRLAAGPLPIEESLSYAKQIAEALEAAHEKGIVHRDLKPANIKVTPDGKVKLLDFGLAKIFATETAGGSTSGATQSPTLTARATAAGVILGTAAYMSPEQARGKTVDKRADIWAFGAVLYEMLSGKKAFAGETVSDTLAAVLTKDPDWSALPPDTPEKVKEILRKGLRREAKLRLRDIGDARLDLEELAATTPLASAGGSPASRELSFEERQAAPRPTVGRSAPAIRERGSRKSLYISGGLAGLLFAALVAVGLALSGIRSRERPKETRPLRLSILHSEGGEVGAPAMSPDGRRVAYRARRADGMPLLWVRDLGTFQARPLAGTEDAYFPFWSPDSRHLAFSTGRALKRVSADGGPVQVVVDGPHTGGAWAPDGTIVFSEWGIQLIRVSASGSASKPATSHPGKDWNQMWPSFLPDGRRFLFTAKLWTRSAEASEQGIYVGSLDNPEVRRLLPDLSSAVYAPPGYIAFVRDGILMAAPFDLDTGRLYGEARPLGEAVAVDMMNYLAAISAAADGTLAVRPPPACALGDLYAGMCDAELRLVDREGRVMSTGALQPYTWRMALAPDGRRVAAQITDRRAGTNDLWLVDLNSGGRAPLTTTHGYAGYPVWSPDGARLAYDYQPPGQLDDVYVKDLRTGQVTPLIETPEDIEHPLAWSHDGAHLLVWFHGWENRRSGLFAWSFASRTLTPFVTSFSTEAAVFSPDDRYVAFSSFESGRVEVYVTTFPERRHTWQLTTEGGCVLSWRADGHEILVATLSGHIAAYPVSTEGGFTAGRPTILVRDVGNVAPFSSATPDHSRILIRVSPDAAKDKGEIRLLFNWAEALKGPSGPR